MNAGDDINMTSYHKLIISDLQDNRILYLNLKKSDNQYNIENIVHI